jgi:hypothetical protein
MKHIAIALLVATGVAHAECHMRMNTNITQQAIFGSATDVQRMVVPDARGFKCVIRYRLNINTDWQTVEGIGVAPTQERACNQASDIKRGVVLGEVTAQKVRADQQLVCSDLPDIRVRTVKLGEVIWESEVDVHTVPAERSYFVYKNTQCRMFVERNSRDQNLFTYQGIICRLNTTKNSKWQVVDKY